MNTRFRLVPDKNIGIVICTNIHVGVNSIINKLYLCRDSQKKVLKQKII